MSNNRPLMPKATAVWLVDNTALTFDQIANFCGLHPLEVKGIADGDVAQGIKGNDPVATGQLTREEIERGEKSPEHELKLAPPKVVIPKPTTRKRGPRYTPVSRRQDRPNAILWLVRNHPELKDAQISRLVGTTKQTITQIRERTHWNSPNLVPQDPVTLGLCTQIDLDAEVKKAAPRVPTPPADEAETGETLLPATETTAEQPQPDTPAKPGDVFAGEAASSSRADRDQEEAAEAARMLEQLQKIGGDEEPVAEAEASGDTAPENAETPDPASEEPAPASEEPETPPKDAE